MTIYTVVGVWDHEGSDDTDLIIAGVFEGDLKAVDYQDNVGEYGVYTRFGQTVEADNPAEAERLVLKDYGFYDDDDESAGGMIEFNPDEVTLDPETGEFERVREE